MGKFDDQLMTSAMKLCASSVRQLLLHGSARCLSCIPRSVSSQFKYCQNLYFLTLTGFAINRDLFQTLVSLPSLAHLKTEMQPFSDAATLESVKSLKSLIVCKPTSDEYNFSARRFVKNWSSIGYWPSEVGIVELERTFVCRAVQEWYTENTIFGVKLQPAEHLAHLHVYVRGMPLQFGQPEQPKFEVHIGPTNCLPVADCESLGLPTGYLLALSGMTLESDQYSCANHIQRILHLTCAKSFTSFSSTISILNLGCSEILESSHLDSVADVCTNLSSLSIAHCTNSLKCLTGLSSIASKCRKLHSLNIHGIHRNRVETILQLWEILRNIPKLQQLAVAPCLIRPEANEESVQVSKQPVSKGSRISRVPAPSKRSTAQMEASLKAMPCLLALDVDGKDCQHTDTTCYHNVSDAELCILANLANLIYLRLKDLPPVSLLYGFTELMGSLSQLKCLYLSKLQPGGLALPFDHCCYRNLEQLCIDCHTFTVTNSLVEALIHNCKLTHVLLAVGSISKKATVDVLQRLPHLTVCFIYVNRSVGPVQGSGSFTRLVRKIAKSRKITNFDFQQNLCRHSWWPARRALEQTLEWSELRPLWHTCL